MDSLVLHVKKCMQQYKIVKPVQLDILATKRRTASTRRFSLTNLEDFLWLQVCDCLTVQDAYRLQRVSRHAARVHHRYNIVCRRERRTRHREQPSSAVRHEYGEVASTSGSRMAAEM